ncbi:MAG: hypothetical protein PHH01_00180 [Patescibacteria group bacterium]|nr:hypothetical protein [Patescibacteria group bacterium]MDD5566598.1 hypothetical protein [Patescibacteria group bacterium]
MSYLKELKARRKVASIAIFFGLIEFIYPQQTTAYGIRTITVDAHEAIYRDLRLTGNNSSLLTCERLPEVPDRPVKKTIIATVTAYSSSIDETDGDPFTTASGSKTHAGVVAYNYLPFGSKVRIPGTTGNKTFIVQDRLRAGASQYHFDIWMPSKAEAKQWGVKVLKIEVL